LKTVLEGTGHGRGESSDAEANRPGIEAVNGEAGQVYGELEQSDNPPTEALLKAAQAVEQEAKGVTPAWEDFKAKQLPAVNEILQKAGKPAIDPEKEPGDMPEAGDEE
jgi:hypothetical protein